MLVVLMLITVGIWAANDDNKMTMVSLGAKEYNVGATYNPWNGLKYYRPAKCSNVKFQFQ